MAAAANALLQNPEHPNYFALREDPESALLQDPPDYVALREVNVDPLFQKLDSLEQSCRSILETLRRQNAVIEAEKAAVLNYPSPSWTTLWTESAEEKDKRRAFIVGKLSQYPEHCQAYRRMTPDLMKQLTDLNQLLGLRKFDRLHPLIRLYLQEDDPYVQAAYMPLRNACKTIAWVASDIMRAARQRFDGMYQMHRVWNGFLNESLSGGSNECTFTDHSRTPAKSFSLSEFPPLRAVLSRVIMPDAPEEAPLAIAIPPDLGKLVQQRFDPIMNRLLAQHSHIAWKWITTSEPVEERGCGWGGLNAQGEFVTWDERDPLIGRVASPVAEDEPV